MTSHMEIYVWSINRKILDCMMTSHIEGYIWSNMDIPNVSIVSLIVGNLLKKVLEHYTVYFDWQLNTQHPPATIPPWTWKDRHSSWNFRAAMVRSAILVGGSGGRTGAAAVIVAMPSSHWNKHSKSSSSSSIHWLILIGHRHHHCRCIFHFIKYPSLTSTVMKIAKEEQLEFIYQNVRETFIQRRTSTQNGALRIYLGLI